MWTVKNTTPFAADGCFIRDRQGKEVWIVAIKATFNILPDGTVETAESQEAVCPLPVYSGEEAASSILYDSDFPLIKPKVDVILNGSAYAPGDEPVSKVDVVMAIGPITKKLTVIGDRFRVKGFLGLTSTYAEPFTKMEITYERAWGGSFKKDKRITTENPVGTGRKHIKEERLPNIQYPDGKKRVAGFGAIAGDWQPRLGLAGTYDEEWQENRMPLLPADFDEAFYQSAPADQQLEAIVGGEQVVLVNLDPTGLLQFSLPRRKFLCISQLGTELHEQTATLQSVILEPDDHRFMMVWHSALPCNKQDHLLDYTYIKEVE